MNRAVSGDSSHSRAARSAPPSQSRAATSSAGRNSTADSSAVRSRREAGRPPPAKRVQADIRARSAAGRPASAGAGAGAPPPCPKATAMGVKVSATTSEISSEKVTVSAWSRKIWPATPTTTKTMGTNTATVVRVEATTAPLTSAAPRAAAAAGASPGSSSRLRWMASSTTIELSTSMPTPSASPPSDITLSDTPRPYIRMKVATIEMGIATPMISVLRSSRRKTYSTSTASRPPSRALLRTSPTALAMNTDWSNRTATSMPSGRRSLTLSRCRRTDAAMSTMLSSPSL
ncbi:MAG: hypothetical protein IPI34_13020 [bacterium]|nr:hypothetical protein [bacterium]